MNFIPFKNIEHFRKETQKQSAFFTSIPLNKYRKGIANRYGFKSTKLLEEQIELNELKDVFVSCANYLLKDSNFKTFVKETLNIKISDFDDIKLAIYYLFEDTNKLSIKKLYDTYGEADFLYSTFQGEESYYLKSYEKLNNLNEKRKYIVSWLFTMLTMIEVKGIEGCFDIQRALSKYGYDIQPLLPSEQKIYQFNESVFIFKNKWSANEIDLSLSQVIMTILNY